MCVVIIGGNECMIRKYKDLCEEYQCRAKVFIEMKTDLKNQIGKPDLIVMFTNTISHKLVRCVMSETKGLDTIIARSHSSSMSALKNILQEHAIMVGT